MPRSRAQSAIVDLARGRMHDHPLYSTWADMVHRCRATTRRRDYGARGIRVCERWRKPRGGFWCFVDDMGSRPTPQHTLDRINNDCGYEPGNCRWATRVEQARNRRGMHSPSAYMRAFEMWLSGATRREISRTTEINDALISGFCRGLEIAFDHFGEEHP